ncbi:phasin family protein [Aureimonas sp. AU12]|uniref:phasin family protein n=1 Tax=Aureimonas sp. AU12 TaxID=1638161 RepID=UPI0007865D4C|nr:phasin family protein [Aureimonas sp. AU12]
MNVYEDANKAGKESMDNALKSFSAVTKGFQQIASETGEFSKRSYEQTAQMFEKLTQVKTLDKAVELQTEYARSAYETWMSQATKMGEMYAEIARETYKPFENTALAAGKFGTDAAKQAM